MGTFDKWASNKFEGNSDVRNCFLRIVSAFQLFNDFLIVFENDLCTLNTGEYEKGGLTPPAMQCDFKPMEGYSKAGQKAVY